MEKCIPIRDYSKGIHVPLNTFLLVNLKYMYICLLFACISWKSHWSIVYMILYHFLCIKCFQFNSNANLLSFERFFSFKSTLGMVTMIRYIIWHFDFAESKNIPSLFWTLKHFEYINTSSSLLPSKSIEILNELLNFKFV